VDLLVERCCGLDVHKDTVVACVRTPGKGGERLQQVRSFGTTTAGILSLRDWLVSERVSLAGMESTGVYWKPVVRHEALIDREGMRGPLRWAVAAA
jgi:transposase